MSDEQAASTRHASPFHCPYCGEQDLWPHDSEAGSGWECRACLRAFSVRLLTLIPHPTAQAGREEVSR